MKKLLLLILTFFIHFGSFSQSVFEISGPESLCEGQSGTFSAQNCSGTLSWFDGSTGTSVTIQPLKTQTIYATCTTNGVKLNTTHTVIVTPVITINSNTGQCFEPNKTILTAAGGTSESRFKWRKDGVPIPDIDNASFAPNAPGDYTAELIHEGEWAFQHPMPDGQQIRDIDFANANLGLAVGTYGTVLRTIDGGKNWDNVTFNNKNDIKGVHFSSGLTAWLLLINGDLYKSTDGGLNWISVVYSSSFFNANEVYFVDANYGWIIESYSSNPRIYKTIDGGLTWNFSYLGIPNQSGNNLLFTDRNVGYFTANENLFKTTDGGVSWLKINSPNGYERIDELGFDFNNKLWLCSYSNSYFTLNGGSSWSSSGLGSIQNIYFYNQSNGVAITSNASIYRTTNGGSSWNFIGDDSAVKVLFMPSSQSVVGVGLAHKIKFSDNIGRTWSENIKNIQNISSIHFINSKEGWLIGKDALFKTSNGGKTWINKQYHQSYSSNSKIYFANENLGFIKSPGTDWILRTDNKGQTWSPIGMDWYSAYDSKIQFVNNTTGFVGGLFTNQLYKTDNAGESWYQIYIPFNNLTDYYFLNSFIGYVANATGLLFKTTNGGISWTSVNSSVSNRYIESIFFENESKGWLTIQNGGTKKTVDGGVNWVNEGVDYISYANYNMIGSDTLLVTTNSIFREKGQMVRSSINGGTNWQNSYIPITNAGAKSMQFVDGRNGWALYNYNIILKYHKVSSTCSSPIFTLNSGPSRPEISSDGYEDFNCSTSNIILTETSCENPNQLVWDNGIRGNTLTISEPSSKIYYATCTNPSGCSSMSKFEIKIDKHLKISKSINPPYCAGSYLNLSYEGNFNQNFEWYRDDVSLGYTKSIIANSPGNYYIKNKNSVAYTLLNPLPTDDSFLNLFQFDDIGIAITNFGLHKSLDSGEHWSKVKDLNRVVDGYFFDQDFGFILPDYSNYILKTTDGGSNFSNVSLPSYSLWRKIIFTSSDKGFILGQNKILKSTDVGKTWVSLSDVWSTGMNWQSIYFINDNVGWICGSDVNYNGKIFKTIDGGDTWVEQKTTENIQLRSLYFIDENIGFSVTSKNGLNQILRTVDGGANWTFQNLNTRSSLEYIAFSTPQIGYAFGYNSYFKTVDGGNTWTTIEVEEVNIFLNGIKFFNNLEGYVFGENGYLLKTNNGGLDWKKNGIGTSRRVSEVSFINENIGYKILDSEEIWKTSNGGIDWKKIDINFNTVFYSMCFTDELTGYLLDYHSNILKTINGGLNWTLATRETGDLRKLYFFNKNTGWAIGYSGKILKTTNAGETWFSQSFNNSHFRDIYFVSDQIGWLIGGDGTIFKTTNGGNTWAPCATINNNYLESVRFFNANHGYIGSYFGLYETVDGGLNWTLIKNPNNYNNNFNVRSIDVFGTNDLIVTTTISIDKSNDGGKTFSSFPISKSPHKSIFIKPYIGWIITDYNSLYKYEASSQPCTSEVVSVGTIPPAPIITNSGANIICEGTSLTLSASNCSGSVKWNTGFTGLSLTVSPQRNGAYYATCSNIAGCSSVASIGINVNEAPKLTTEFIDPCQTLLLKADNLPPFSDLVWSKNGAPFSADSYELNGPNRTTQNNLGTYSVMNKSKNSWNNISATENKGTFMDIKFLTSNLGFAVTYGGAIYKSTDGGNSWELKNSHTYSNLFEICIVDAQHIWIAGNELLYSLDAGENWTLMPRPENDKFLDIFFTDMNNGWLLSNHSIYKTTDGGSSWIKTYTTTSFLQTIHAFNNTVLVGGDVGFLVKSNDLGATWQETPLNTIRSIFDIHMYSDSLYWICGNYDVLRKSVDGGQTWINAYPNNNSYLTDIQVISNQEVLAFGNSQIYKSRDGGNSWQGYSLSDITYDFFAFDVDNILVAGYGMKKSVGDFTQWKGVGQFELLLSNEHVRSMQFLDASTGYMASRNVIGKTVDGGRNWSKTTLFNYTYLNDIFFVNESVGYASGYNARLLKTIDGGHSWLSLSGNLPSALPSNLARHSIYFKDVNTGWLTVTDNTTNYLIKTTDGGVTWNIIYTNTNSSFSKIKFNGSRGVILSDEAILVSNDEGISWSFSNLNGIGYGFSDVQIFDANTVYLTSISEEGFYFKSSDGGMTWVRKQFSVTGHTPTYIKFFNNNEGWIGTPYNAFHTTDGGLTWEMSYLNGDGYSAMYFLSPSEGWAAGMDVLKLNTSAEPACPSTDTYVFSGINSILKNPSDNIIANPVSGINEVKLNAKYGTIQAENLVLNNGTKAIYEAKSIELQPGFKADKGTTFTAEPGGCTN